MMKLLAGIAMGACMLLPAKDARASDLLAGYEQVDLTDFEPREGPSAVGLLIDLFEAHPESLEGNPKSRIELSRIDGEQALQVDLEMTGLLDDALLGERYRAVIAPASAWRLERLGRQVMCARGDTAGQWTNATCP